MVPSIVLTLDVLSIYAYRNVHPLANNHYLFLQASTARNFTTSILLMNNKVFLFQRTLKDKLFKLDLARVCILHRHLSPKWIKINFVRYQNRKNVAYQTAEFRPSSPLYIFKCVDMEYHVDSYFLVFTSQRKGRNKTNKHKSLKKPTNKQTNKKTNLFPNEPFTNSVLCQYFRRIWHRQRRDSAENTST